MLSTEITKIKGVGDATARLFARIGVKTVGDLIDHYPRRYEDYSQIQSIADLEPGPITVKAKLHVSSGGYGKSRGTHITKARAEDDSGAVLQVVWFNQPYRAASIQNGKEYYLSGLYDYSGKYLSLTNPSLELASSFTVNTARVLPVYPETKGLTSARIRKTMKAVEDAFEHVSEVLPRSVISDMLPLKDAIKMLHFPGNTEDIATAKHNLGFRELFELSLSSQLLKKDIEAYRSPHVPIDEEEVARFVKNLPFALTDTQKKVAWRILTDMADNKHPMNRMVEGDVGSGKTVLAAIAAWSVCLNGGQVALMAPTELLAAQHQESLTEIFSGFLEPNEIAFLSGSQTKSVRSEALARVESGQAKLIIGTHALFQKTVIGSQIELLIIDEQHRFGVNQRETLLGKAKKVPHVLTMTATPIPRTLSLVLYGELSVSILHEKPPGRKQITTELVSLASRYDQLKTILAGLHAKNQLYLVCPSIDESDVSDSIESVSAMLDSKFPNVEYAVLTGRMKQEEKDEIMTRFSSGQVNVLLATTVIEVGVNVVTASKMAIFSPERFGLAQLHQLRGRVGRGDQAGECYLLLNSNNKPTRRLEMIARINDGFKLAEIDLELRGPGALYGTRQSGALDLRIASLTDTRLVKKAHSAAADFVASGQSLLEYKSLQSRVLDLQKVTNLN